MSRKKKYVVHLTDEQRDQLNSLTSKGTNSARKIRRANILLLSEQQKTAKEISQTLKTDIQSVYNIRKRFVEEGLESTLNERPRPGAPLKLSDKAEKVAIAIACSTPPEGRSCWTMQMIADKLVELKYVDGISEDTIRLRLKKTQ
jgi:transposase